MCPGHRAFDDEGMSTPLRSRLSNHSPALAVAAATAVIGIAGLRGADYPAHYVRAIVWERAGGAVWSNVWYAGHPTLPYSVLAPPLMALLGPFAVVASGSIAATAIFSALTRELLPTSTTSLANHVFAAAMFVNVVVGRAPFAFGLAVALLAVYAWHRRWMAVAMLAAALSPMVSPVSGVFLAIAATAVVFAGQWRRRWEGVAIAAAATAPLAVVGVMFAEPVVFPYRGGHLALTVAVLLLVAAAIRVPSVRHAALAGTAAACVLFVWPNPLGGNYVRLAQIVAVPMAVLGLAHVRRLLLLPFCTCLTVAVAWSIHPGVVAAVEWRGDPSVDVAYHLPLVEEVQSRNRDGRPTGRLEIPFTENHWESLFVAPEVPFARGWERQLDIARNPCLYDPALSFDGYHDWLHDFGVRWIAIPDVTLDHAGRAEQRLLSAADRRRVDWLQQVWANADWKLYEVTDYTPIVAAPAELVQQGADFVVVQTPHPATVTVKYRFTDHLTITGGATVTPDDRGWIVAHLPAAGQYRLTV